MHYCGKGDHFVPILTKCDALTGINLSQPHLNDMDKIYANTVGRGKRILALAEAACIEYEKRQDAVPSMVYCGAKSSVQNHEVKA